MAFGSLLCLGRHTITGFLTTAGRQEVDWSADYRLFERQRVDTDALFHAARQAVVQRLEPSDPLVVPLDDVLLRKRGKKVAGTSWWRDPLGPPFQANLVWGQRFLPLSAMWPEQAGASRARAIPIDLHHCPMPKKPSPKASAEEWQAYETKKKTMKVSQQGVNRLHRLRDLMDQDPQTRNRRLVVPTDGGFTNRTVGRNLPPRTTLIGRIRKDAKLFAVPSTGRRKYGERLPTPEALRQDVNLPWITVPAVAAGQVHDFSVKTLSPVRSPLTGDRDRRVVIIRPLAYRLTKHSRWLYRDPAYLVCTDPNEPRLQVVQGYVWRNEIEVNFREEKTVLGIDQPQVRTATAVETVPRFLTAVYALFLVALQCCTTEVQETWEALRPKWRQREKPGRPSTQQALHCFRAELWGLVVGSMAFTPFVNDPGDDTKPLELEPSFSPAIFYASG